MKKFAWTQDNLGVINTEKVRNFTLKLISGGYEVIAWFSDRESVSMGMFDDDRDAREFLEKLLGEKK